MSEANPVKAMSALIPEPITTPEGVVVRPLTLGVFALLERIKSPTLVRCKTDSLALLPSLYILTHDPREVLERFGELDALAVAWADTLPPHAIGAIEAAAAVQIQRMLDVIAPEGDSKKKRPQRLDHLPRAVGVRDLPVDAGADSVARSGCDRRADAAAVALQRRETPVHPIRNRDD